MYVDVEIQICTQTHKYVVYARKNVPLKPPRIYTNMCVYARIHKYVCIYTQVCVYIHTNMCVYVCICTNIRTIKAAAHASTETASSCMCMMYIRMHAYTYMPCTYIAPEYITNVPVH